MDSKKASNYRPISISTSLSKVFEHVLLSRLNPYLKTEDNQMGFKPGVSTETSVLLLKEAVQSYILNESNVFGIFLDASKAFDRINHKKLFMKLSKQGVPLSYVELLFDWYSNQRCCVRWDSIQSDYFCVTNGVQQGSL